MLHSDIESMDPKAQPIFTEFLAKLKEAGIAVKLLETLRELAVVIAYFAQGRKPLVEVNALRKMAGLPPIGDAENRTRISNCDGTKYKSNHQSGRAADIWPLHPNGEIWWNAPLAVWESIAAIGEGLGLVWGGRWKDPYDPCHWELKADE